MIPGEYDIWADNECSDKIGALKKFNELCMNMNKSFKDITMDAFEKENFIHE
jgi:hypothetical protein